MRTIKIIKLDSSRVRSLENELEEARTSGEAVRVELPVLDCCPNVVVPLVAIVDRYSHFGVIQEVAGLDSLDATVLERSKCRSFGRVWRFTDDVMQGLVVSAYENELMSIPTLGRGFRVSFTWCINEIMDNVLTHSAPGGGPCGYVMVQYDQKHSLLKACVFDFGIGLLSSFGGSAKYNPQTSAEAIDLAVRAGVTSGKGQGNGLWGLHELIGQSVSGGRLLIKTGNGEYLYDKNQGIESSRECQQLVAGVPGGALVDFQLACGDPLSIDAVFPSTCRTADVWLENRENENGTVRIEVSKQARSTGSRGAGRDLRTIVENVLDVDQKDVVLDFVGVETCGSAFIDELVGKLIEKYGLVAFSQHVRIVNLRGIGERLLNHSLAQRLAAHVDAWTPDVGASGAATGSQESAFLTQSAREDSVADSPMGDGSGGKLQ